MAVQNMIAIGATIDSALAVLPQTAHHPSPPAGGGIVFGFELALFGTLLNQRLQRRRAETRVRKNEAGDHTVVDGQTDLLCRFRPDTTLTFVNDAYCQFFGKTRADLIRTKWAALVPSSERAAVLDRIGRITRGSDAHEHEMLLPDGSIGWLHWVNSAIVDENGHLTELQGVWRDITDRKRAELAIGELERRNSAMLRAIPDLMFVLKRDGTYLDYHARDPQLLFLPPDAFIGKRVQDVMPPALAELFLGAIERAFAEGGPVVVEYVLTMAQPRHYEARVVTAGDDRVLSIVRDVTDSHRALLLNRDLVGRLITAQEEERRWLARELHDGALQDIAAVSAELAELRHVADGVWRERQATIQKVQTRISALAENLRRLSHGLHPTVLQHVGLVAALKSYCSEFEQRRHVHVDYAAKGTDDPASASVSPSLFRITQEALRNAIRHGHARHLAVSLVRDYTHLSLTIRDNGSGFDVSLARQHGGLGLVSIEERARLVQGSVTINSAPGRGTDVVVRVPVDVVDRVESQPSEPMRVMRLRDDRAPSP